MIVAVIAMSLPHDTAQIAAYRGWVDRACLVAQCRAAAHAQLPTGGNPVQAPSRPPVTPAQGRPWGDCPPSDSGSKAPKWQMQPIGPCPGTSLTSALVRARGRNGLRAQETKVRASGGSVRPATRISGQTIMPSVAGGRTTPR